MPDPRRLTPPVVGARPLLRLVYDPADLVPPPRAVRPADPSRCTLCHSKHDEFSACPPVPSEVEARVPRTFDATQRRLCVTCDCWIEPGEPVRYVGSNTKGVELVHVECADD